MTDSEDVNSGISLEQFLKVHKLDDLDNLTAEDLLGAMEETNAKTIRDYTVLSNLADYQIFEARSRMCHASDSRDLAWWSLDCWGPNLVAREGLSHIRYRIIQHCIECANNVALCANALSLFDVDWYVLAEGPGYRLCSDDGSVYRRPDVAVAVKFRYFGVKPLVVMDVFSRESSYEMIRESAENWLHNWASIQVVITVQVTVNYTSNAEEINPAANSENNMTVTLNTKSPLPQSCTTKIYVWERGSSTSSSAYGRHSPLRNPTTPNTDVTRGAHVNGSFDSSASFISPPPPFISNVRTQLDRSSINEDFPLDSEPTSQRKASTVILGDPSWPQSGASGNAGRGMQQNNLSEKSSVNGVARKEGLMRCVASCATLATVPSESDFPSVEQCRFVQPSALVEGVTRLTFTRSTLGFAAHLPGTMTINGKTEFQLFVGGADNTRLEIDDDNLSAGQAESTAGCQKLRCHTPDDSDADHTGDMLLTIPLSKLTSAIQRYVSLSDSDRDKAQVVRFSINPERLVHTAVLVGLNRDISFKDRCFKLVALPG